MRTGKRSTAVVVAALSSAVALALAPALSASATTYRIPTSGLQSLYVDNEWINYSTYRDKTTTTYANWSTIQVTCSLDLRLRSTTRNPATNPLFISYTTTGTFWYINNAHPEDGRLPAGSYAFSGRSLGTYGCTLGTYIGFAGNLTW